METVQATRHGARGNTSAAMIAWDQWQLRGKKKASSAHLRTGDSTTHVDFVLDRAQSTIRLPVSFIALRQPNRPGKAFLTLFRVAFCAQLHEMTSFGVDYIELRIWLRTHTVADSRNGRCGAASTGARPGASRIPKVFRTRIKRLLDIDRELELDDEEVAPGVDHTFAPPPGVASGDVAYRAVDAFSLAIGLDLLDTGFKQAEIVTLMRYLRSDLEKRFPDLLEPPSLIDRQLYPAADFPALPTYGEDGHKFADRRLFVILQKVELTEILPRSSRRQPKKPVILRPVFCKGIERLGKELHLLMPYHRRALTILELASTAQAVRKHLADAPAVRRGRPRG